MLAPMPGTCANRPSQARIKVNCTVLGRVGGELGPFSAGTKNQGYGVDFWIIVHTLTDMLKT